MKTISKTDKTIATLFLLAVFMLFSMIANAQKAEIFHIPPGNPDNASTNPAEGVKPGFSSDNFNVLPDSTETAYESVLVFVNNHEFSKEENMDKSSIEYSVVLGIYKNKVPIEVLNEYLALKDMKSLKRSTGVTLFTSKTFRNYNTAVKHKENLVQKGFQEALVITIFKGKIIFPEDKLLAFN